MSILRLVQFPPKLTKSDDEAEAEMIRQFYVAVVSSSVCTDELDLYDAAPPACEIAQRHGVACGDCFAAINDDWERGRRYYSDDSDSSDDDRVLLYESRKDIKSEPPSIDVETFDKEFCEEVLQHTENCKDCTEYATRYGGRGYQWERCSFYVPIPSFCTCRDFIEIYAMPIFPAMHGKQGMRHVFGMDSEVWSPTNGLLIDSRTRKRFRLGLIAAIPRKPLTFGKDGDVNSTDERDYELRIFSPGHRLQKRLIYSGPGFRYMEQRWYHIEGVKLSFGEKLRPDPRFLYYHYLYCLYCEMQRRREDGRSKLKIDEKDMRRWGEGHGFIPAELLEDFALATVSNDANVYELHEPLKLEEDSLIEMFEIQRVAAVQRYSVDSFVEEEKNMFSETEEDTDEE